MDPNRKDPPNNKNNQNDPQNKRPKNRILVAIVITVAIVIIISLIFNAINGSKYTETDYNHFLLHLESNQLSEVESKMEVLLGTVEVIEGRTYDTILANINRNIILGDLDRYAAALNKGGHLLLSGFLHEDVEPIVAACSERGITLERKISEEEWVSLKLVKSK